MNEQIKDFLSGSVVKDSPASVGDMGSTPGSGRSPGEVNDNTLPVSLPGKCHGQRNWRAAVYGAANRRQQHG